MPEQDYYESAQFWGAERYINTDDTNRFMAAASLIPATVQSLVDIGCGNGTFLAFLEQQRPAIQLKGLERSQSARESAICKTEIMDGSIDALPFADRSINILTALEVIEHLPYGVFQESLQELERVASDYILISVPYREKRTQVECPNCRCHFNPYYHMQSFDEEKLSGLFNSFTVVSFQIITIDDYLLAPVLRAAYRLLSRNKDFPETALCPQCGYKGATSEHQPARHALPNTRRYLRDNLKDKLPRRKHKNWIIGLYQRRKPTAG